MPLSKINISLRKLRCGTNHLLLIKAYEVHIKQINIDHENGVSHYVSFIYKRRA
jgi:hypothetical protein